MNSVSEITVYSKVIKLFDTPGHSGEGLLQEQRNHRIVRRKKVMDSKQWLTMRFQDLCWRNGTEKQPVAMESINSCTNPLAIVGSISHIL